MLESFAILEKELLPPKKRKPQLASTETQVSLSDISVPIKEEPKDDTQVTMSNMPVPLVIKEEPKEDIQVATSGMPVPLVIKEDTEVTTSNMPAPVIIKEEPRADIQDDTDDVIFVSASPAIKEEPIESKIEDSSDEESEEEEESVWTLIKDWNLDNELRPIFTKYKITLEVLQNMKDEDLNVMVPDEQIAVRVLLRTNLQKWQKFNGYGPFANENMTSTSAAPTTSNNWERPVFGAHTSTLFTSTNEDLLSKDLESILKSSPKGKHVLDYRFLYPLEPLSKNWRTCLCETIADYCIQRKHVLKNTHFNHLSNEVIRLFPAESKDEYFTPHISKEGKTVSDPCGYLADEYNYKCEKLRQACQPPSKYKHRKRAASPNSLDNCTKEQHEKAKNWLKKHRQPWDGHKGVVYKWKQTFRIRRTSFMSTVRKEPILDEWPIVSHSLGHSLIESDFDQIFADKSQALYNKWDHFCAKIIPIFETDIRDSIGFGLYQSLLRLENKEMKDCICCQLINSVLAPTEEIQLQMRTPEGKMKYNVWRPSIRDARTSFFNLAYSEENAKSTAAIMATRYTKLGLIPQPLIFGIGYRNEAIKQFLVIYHSMTYTLNSFLKALDIVFKLYHVINLEYNPESHSMWLFIQKYFFDIIRPYDLKPPGLNKLMSRLR